MPIGTAVEQRGRHVRSFCWALPLDADGRPAPLGDDVLHAPTVTTERLGLPARLIADVPLDPDRRRVRTGAATDTVLRAAADAYLDLVAAVAPADRLALVPAAGFPRSELDARLRALLLDVLREAAWLPGADGGEVAPRAATVLDLPAPDLPALLADVVPGLLAAPGESGRPRLDRANAALGRSDLPNAAFGQLAAALLTELGVERLGAAALADRLLGVRRPAAWWRAVYAALEPAVDTVPGLLDELRALPVPLTDGRTVPGPAGVLLPLGADAGRVGRRSRCPGCTSRTRTPCTRCWSGSAPRSPSPAGCSTTRRCATRSTARWTTPRRGWTRCRWPRRCSGWSPRWGRRRATGWPRSP